MVFFSVFPKILFPNPKKFPKSVLGKRFWENGALQQRVPHKEVLQDEEEKFQGPL